jgi:hypothetical protein
VRGALVHGATITAPPVYDRVVNVVRACAAGAALAAAGYLTACGAGSGGGGGSGSTPAPSGGSTTVLEDTVTLDTSTTGDLTLTIVTVED